MIILKIGGSAITKKNAIKPTIDHENLDRICSELQYTNQQLILIHGAGSYGHIYAKQYEVGSKIETNSKERLMGVAKTQNSAQKLNNIVCEKLQEYQIPAIGIQPSAFIRNKNGKIIKFDYSIIKQYLDDGFVPVLYGDAILDENNDIKSSILSGDQIIKYLGENLRPEKVILGSDVDGIYTKNPNEYDDAELLEVVTKDTILESDSTHDAADVTGGMNGKINELLELAKKGVCSQIINAEKPGNIRNILENKKIKSTIIK
ncbi:MAG: isopentenyl phosphate kinase [Methanobacteriaceae archaeon]|nr:isopentenyl phosphate kinase [Methanobacteriaceae archaeon]